MAMSTTRHGEDSRYIVEYRGTKVAWFQTVTISLTELDLGFFLIEKWFPLETVSPQMAIYRGIHRNCPVPIHNKYLKTFKKKKKTNNNNNILHISGYATMKLWYVMPLKCI